MNIIWIENKDRYANGVIGYLGKYKIFQVDWDSIGNNNPWILSCSLPGIKNYLGNYKTREEANEKAEKVLEHWLKNSGLKK